MQAGKFSQLKFCYNLLVFKCKKYRFQLIYDRYCFFWHKISRKFLAETLLLSIVSAYSFTLSSEGNYYSLVLIQGKICPI